MVREGKAGSITIFYKDVLLASYPLTKLKTLEAYKDIGTRIILDTMRVKPELTVKKQIYTYLYFVNLMYKRKLNNESIWRSNYELLMSCIMALIKLQILNMDDTILVMPPKRPKRLF